MYLHEYILNIQDPRKDIRNGGHRSAPAKSSKKAARPYHLFLQAVQTIFDPL